MPAVRENTLPGGLLLRKGGSLAGRFYSLGPGALTSRSPTRRTIHKEDDPVYGIIVIAVYTAIMLGVTLVFSKKAQTAGDFHTADRQLGLWQIGRASCRERV